MESADCSVCELREYMREELKRRCPNCGHPPEVWNCMKCVEEDLKEDFTAQEKKLQEIYKDFTKEFCEEEIEYGDFGSILSTSYFVKDDVEAFEIAEWIFELLVEECHAK
jgi:hypothetical protein